MPRAPRTSATPATPAADAAVQQGTTAPVAPAIAVVAVGPDPATLPVTGVPNDKEARAREAISRAQQDMDRAADALRRSQHAMARSRALGDSEAAREAVAIVGHHQRIAAKQAERAARWHRKCEMTAESMARFGLVEVLRCARVASLAAQLAVGAAYYAEKYAPGSERDLPPETEEVTGNELEDSDIFGDPEDDGEQ